MECNFYKIVFFITRLDVKRAMGKYVNDSKNNIILDWYNVEVARICELNDSFRTIYLYVENETKVSQKR